MIAMRLASSDYNPVKECGGCVLRDENIVNANILSFQLAHLLLTKYRGNWEIGQDELTIYLEGLERPLRFELSTGNLAYGTLRTFLLSRYSPDAGLKDLFNHIIRDFGIEARENETQPDELFTLLVNLIEIYHARCGLRLMSINDENQTIGWELLLCEEGLKGKLTREGVIENRFGEKFDIKEWKDLRPEKKAAYVFGFNKFCKHYLSPSEQLD